MRFLKQLSALLAVFILLTVSSCQRDIDIYVPDNNNIGQILNPAPVQASVAGKVTDQNGNDVVGATVRSGNNSTTTDSRGLFRFSNIGLDKYASVVTVEFNGYFKGIRTFSAASSSTNYIRIKLIQKVLAGTVDATTGGTATLPNNSIVTLQANSVVLQSNGQAYTGTVNVYAANIDPTTSDITERIPGSFQATDAGNFRVLLKSYGMLAVQLEGQGGELLQIASNKTARLHFTIPSSLSSAAPATIALWSLNETDGLWKEEGQATKTGDAYEGDVAHFSFWNCDASNSTVYLEMNIATADGPLPNALVKITRTSNGAWSYGYTDSIGHVGGLVFSNEAMTVEILNNCYEPAYTQNIGPYTQNTSLGTITVVLPSQYSFTISGSAVNCNAAPVTDGYASIFFEGMAINTAIVNGNFSTTITRCATAAAQVEVIVVDNTSAQQSAVFTGSVSGADFTTGALSACGLSTFEFINYNIDNNGYGLSFVDTLNQVGTQGDTLSVFSGISSSSPTLQVNFSTKYMNVMAGATQPLLSFTANTLEGGAATTINAPINVSITEFGSIGQYIAGEFSGIINGASGADHYVTCSFRVKRQF